MKTNRCVYHLDAELVQEAIDELKTLPYEDVYEILAELLLEHRRAQRRPYVPEIDVLMIHDETSE